MGSVEDKKTQVVADMKGIWAKKRGNRTKVHSGAPKWARIRQSMQSAFPTYFEENPDTFAQDINYAITQLNILKPTVDGPPYLGDVPGVPDYSKVTSVEMDEDFGDLYGVIDDAVDLFDGMPNWSHPQTMCNVIPPGNKAGIIGAMLANVFCPNIIEGEYSWNVLKAEMESSTMVARLIGWDVDKAGGLFTYGGSGCYLYGIKYAITRVLQQESRCTGVRTDGKLLVSQQGHYCMMNSTDWLGLGMNNIVTIETDDDTNEMDTDDLIEKMEHFQSQGIPIIAVVCTMGTTDAFAVDPVDKVREIVDNHPNPEGFGKTVIYCDAVIGWSWLTFSDYNFEENPLQFSQDLIPIIQNNYNKIAKVVHADVVGTDFHKTGWAPYNCSMVMMKDLNEFRGLMTRPGSAYLQERTPHNPGLYTLEVSRSGTYAMAGWATLKFLGRQGFQSVLGGILQIQKYLRDRLHEEKDMVCVNEEDHGFVTLIRVYPDGVDAEAQYEKEKTDINALEDLRKSNKLQEDIANAMWDWFRSGQKQEEMYGPYTSYTSGFRPTDYNDDFEGDAVIYGIKSFPMNVNTTTETMEDLITQLRIARTKAMKVPKDSTAHEEHLIPPPYSAPNPSIVCEKHETEGTPAHAQVGTLLSGIGRRMNQPKSKKGKGKAKGQTK